MLAALLASLLPAARCPRWLVPVPAEVVPDFFPQVSPPVFARLFAQRFYA